MSKINVAAGSPAFIVALAREVERGFVSRVPVSPVLLPTYSAVDLPDPAVFVGCVIMVKSVNTTMAMSDGQYWYPVTLGAHF
jgi:hypothetical protein